MAWGATELMSQGGWGFGNAHGDGYGSGSAYGDSWGFGNAYDDGYGDGSGCAEGVPISVVILGRTQLHKRRLSDG